MTQPEHTKSRRNNDLTAANAKRMRASEEKKAAVLRARGWVCIPPEEVEKGEPRTDQSPGL